MHDTLINVFCGGLMVCFDSEMSSLETQTQKRLGTVNMRFYIVEI